MELIDCFSEVFMSPGREHFYRNFNPCLDLVFLSILHIIESHVELMRPPCLLAHHYADQLWPGFRDDISSCVRLGTSS